MSVASKVKRLLGLERHEKREVIRSSIDDVINIIRKTNKDEINSIEKESKQFKNQILSDFREFKKIIEDFKSLKHFDDLSKASSLVKDNFCVKALAILTEIKAIEISEPKDFISKAHEILDRIERITPRQAMHIGLFFKDKAKEIANKAKEIRQKLNEYQDFLDTNILADIEKIEDKISEIREIENKIKYIEMSINNIEKDIKMLETKPLPPLDYTKLDKLENELNEIIRLKKEIEQEIETEFGAIKKVLKKFSYGLTDKHKLSIINQYLSSASEGFLVNDKNFEIKKILEEIKLLKEEGKIEIDEKRYEKICHIIRNPLLLMKRDEYNKINNIIRNKKMEIESEKARIEEIKKIRNKIKEIEDKMIESNRMKSQLEDSRNKLINEREEKIRDIEFMCSELINAKISLQ
ncbi:MAG: hypothetical protein QXQ40_02525 [Candidatus Aenigmatarchaeota archaeon]